MRLLNPARRLLSGHPKQFPFGFVFDVDGTLVRGESAIPGSAEALIKLASGNIPYACLTNSGSASEAMKARDVGNIIGVDFPASRMFVGSSPLRSLRKALPPTAQVVFFGGREVEEIAASYGFKNIIVGSDLPTLAPHAFPKQPTPPMPLSSQAIGRKVAYSYPPHNVDAVILLSNPASWYQAAQAICDIARVSPAMRLIAANDDVLFTADFPHARLGFGCFRRALHTVVEAALPPKHASRLRAASEVWGKPHRIAYHGVLAHAPGVGECDVVYMVGDNPDTDVAGGNAMGAPFRTVLVASPFVPDVGAAMALPMVDRPAYFAPTAAAFVEAALVGREGEYRL